MKVRIKSLRAGDIINVRGTKAKIARKYKTGLSILEFGKVAPVFVKFSDFSIQSVDVVNRKSVLFKRSSLTRELQNFSNAQKKRRYY